MNRRNLLTDCTPELNSSPLQYSNVCIDIVFVLFVNTYKLLYNIINKTFKKSALKHQVIDTKDICLDLVNSII